MIPVRTCKIIPKYDDNSTARSYLPPVSGDRFQVEINKHPGPYETVKKVGGNYESGKFFC
jgi:hypothetical protein